MERMNTWGGFYELGSQSSSRSSLSIEEAQPESILPGFGNRCSLTAEGAAELLVSLHHLDAQRCLQNPQPVPNKKGKEQKVGSYSPAAEYKEECSADSTIALHDQVCSDCGCTETCFWRRDRATGMHCDLLTGICQPASLS